MFLADYHMHSSASFDAEDTMAAMALASVARGMTHICFTDHIDLDYYETGEFDEKYWDKWPEILKQYDASRRICPPDLDMRLGIELSVPHHYTEIAEECAAHEDLDFIIGSIHNNRHTPDFYGLKYESREHCVSLLREYFTGHMELAKYDFFDVVAHIGYTRRYMLQAGYDIRIDTKTFGDELEALFKLLIERGRGIEVNCSGFRHPGIAGPIPSFDVIKLYRELGGEIITVGSDAHRVEDAGSFVEAGTQLLCDAGFKYVTLFEKRKPIFTKII